jgi:predicted amidophosphoribosyltransferase
MPLRTKIECPECEADLAVKRGGVCPNCGARISEHVARERRRERRIEQVVAIVGTALVLGLYLATSGSSLLEGSRHMRWWGCAVLSRPAHVF